MVYKIEFKNSAQKEFYKIPEKDRIRIWEKLNQLAVSEFGLDIKWLENEDGLKRLRVGDYRVIYKKYEILTIIEVVKVAIRKDAYK